MVGDSFVQMLGNNFREMKNQNSLDRRSGKPTLFMMDYYNIKVYEKFLSKREDMPAIAHILNATIEAVNENKHLPKYLLIAIDADILSDLKSLEDGAVKEMTRYINWLTKQIDIIIRKKKLQITEVKPGAVNNNHPHIISVTMVKRMDHYPPHSKLAKICTLRAKFNDLLNNAEQC